MEVRQKWLNALLVISSLIGYNEWGGGNSAFLFEAEYEIIMQLLTDPVSAIHPFTIIPLLGQLLLLITLFQKHPSKRLTYIGMGFIGLLLVFMFLIGLMALHLKTTLSTLPFIILSIVIVVRYRRISRSE